MSVSTYLSPSLTGVGVVDPQFKYRQIGTGLNGSSIVQSGNLCYLTLSLISDGGSGATSGVIPCPNITATSVIQITSPSVSAGLYAVSIVPGVSFTLTSPAGGDVGRLLSYLVIG